MKLPLARVRAMYGFAAYTGISGLEQLVCERNGTKTNKPIEKYGSANNKKITTCQA